MRRAIFHGRNGTEYCMMPERYWAFQIVTTFGECWRIYAATSLSKATAGIAKRADFVKHIERREITQAQFHALKAKLAAKK